MLKLILSLLLVAAMNAAAQNSSIKFQSAQEQTALLELYTSEGCSSCPPAEAWLSHLHDSPGLWKDFVPVAFHVDYWNHLGWKDPWSDVTFSERQQAYAQLWHSDNIYTPEFALDGVEWHDWIAGKNSLRPSTKTTGILTVSSLDGNIWQASFVPERPGSANYEIHAALLAGGIISEVKAGENRGRSLNHDFVVLKLVQIKMKTSNGLAKGKFILTMPRTNNFNTLAMAAWVTSAGELKAIQATGGWLIPPAKKQL